MRKESSETVTAAARRRLEMLGRELADAGLRPMPVDDPERGSGVDPPPSLVPDPGRHSRARRNGPGVVDRIESRLPGPLQGRLALRATHLVLISALLAVGVVVAAWATLRAAPDEVPVPMAHTSPAATGGSAFTASSAASSTASPVTGTTAGASEAARPGPAEVVVDVVGKVRRPGVVTLPVGSRVVDALKQADGARKGVDLSTLNLARVLVDGEQIVVGRKATSTAPQIPGAGGAAPGAKVSLNAAGLEQLETLPGVGPVTAQKILDWRTEHGAFSSIDDLLDVDGIGTKTLVELSPHVVL